MSLPKLPPLSQLAPGNGLLGNLARKPFSHDAGEMTDEDLQSLLPDSVFSVRDLIQARKLVLPMLMAVGKPLDDRSLVMEKLVELLQQLPLNSKTSEFLAHKFIAMLWRDLPHPAGTHVHPVPSVVSIDQATSSGEIVNTRFRNADGYGNNLIHPEMGKAGTPYARSVPPSLTKPANLPDPELVYDRLLRRPDGHFEAHPRGLNRLFFSFATVVIHECFQTSDLRRQDINGTTSYVDLSTLYGNNQEEQDSVRTHVKGMIHTDSFASRHIGMMPPGVIAVLILFSRNHNRIAQRLYEVNEGGRYKPWDSLDDDGMKLQDEMIFQFARNINVGWFATVVLKDYVPAILATKEANSDWWLDLGAEIHDATTGRLDRGTGLQNTAEFNALYHWHSALSSSDAQWMKKTVLTELHKDPACREVTLDTITPAQFWKVAAALKGQKSGSPSTWSWPDYLERQPDGRVRNDQLVTLLKTCIEEPAHRFGARAIPSAMRIVEVMGQIVTRDTFNLCSMNEFRRYLNLKTFSTFEEWNSSKPIAEAARELYGHIDNLEIYPGLLAEESKPPVPGSGLCPGHTIGRAILADAVQLVRGDRFLTFDFNASTLTNWGAQKIVTPAGGSYGGLLPLLIEGGLPNEFGGRYSAWALMPFHTPTAKAAYLTKNGVIDKYRTERPSKRIIRHTTTFLGCKTVLEQLNNSEPPEVKELGHVQLQFAAGERGTKISDSDVRRALLFDKYKSSTEAWVRQCTREEIAQHSIAYSKFNKTQLDVVRDICNNVPMRWLAHRFGIPLKSSSDSSDNAYTVRELQETLTDLFSYSNFDGLTEDAWSLRENAKEQWSQLNHIFRARLYRSYGILGLPRTVQGMVTADFEHTHGTTTRPPLGQMARKVVSAAIHPIETLSETAQTVMQMYASISSDAQNFYQELMKCGTLEECVDVCFAIVVPLAATITRQLSLVIDLLLEPEYAKSMERVVQLAKQDTAVADKEIIGHIYEAMRIRGITCGLPRTAVGSGSVRETADNKQRLEHSVGDTVIANLQAANRDTTVFPDPKSINPIRNVDLYALTGCAPYLSCGNDVMMPAMLAVVKEVFKLPGLRRAITNGKLTKLSEGVGRAGWSLSSVFLDQRYSETRIPTSMSVEYATPVATATTSTAAPTG